MSRWKIIGLATLCLLVAGCEFSPLYGPDSPRESYVNQTDITVTGNLDPRKLESVLLDQFGKPTGERSHHLTVDFVISDESGPIQGSGGVYQYIVLGKAKVAFFDLNNGDLIYSDTINARARWTSSKEVDGDYEVIRNEVLANLEARDDALNRLRRLMADRIYTRIIAIKPNTDIQQ
ncbi:MAG: hypothetical protein OXH90_11210 [Paracoccaceae bacterium]|nr:hypothetical protein [Paracoccaceae bacterium]MDE2760850.1 hypothetical protein [Paracoccaceae bacterium]MDE2917882.1 hypothetical protein [Paracoccaceae bacterium]